MKKTKKTNKQTDLATTNEKLYENFKIVELYEKKTAPLIDKIRMKKCNPIPTVLCALFGQVHDEELSNCHKIENHISRTVAWFQKLILVIMHIEKHTNSCSACHEIEHCSSNPSAPLILRTKLALCSGSKQEKEPQESIRDCNKHCGHKCREGIKGRPTLVATSIRHPQDTSNTSTQNPWPLGDVSGGFTYIDKDLARALSM